MRSVFVLTVLVLATAAAAAQAQGRFASLFNAAAPVTITGWVRSVQWKAPNVQIQLSGVDRNGPSRAWTVLAGAPETLAQRGLCPAALKAGTHVTISGYESRDKPCQRGKPAGCSAGGSLIVFDGGQTIDLGFRPDGASLVGVPGSSQLPGCSPPVAGRPR